MLNNIAFTNGWGVGGNGNGFKVSTNNGGNHKLYGNIAFLNKRGGFDEDKMPGHPRNVYYHNIAYKNGPAAGDGFIMDNPNLPTLEDPVLLNNIGASNVRKDIYYHDGNAVNRSDYNYWEDGDFVPTHDANSLNLSDGPIAFNNPDVVIDTIIGFDFIFHLLMF